MGLSERGMLSSMWSRRGPGAGAESDLLWLTRGVSVVVLAGVLGPGGVGQLFDRYAGERLLSAHGGSGVSVFSPALSLDEHVLSLGRSGSGLPSHSHGESWLELLHGHKLWLLHPPGPLPEALHSWSHELEQVPLTDWLSTRLQRADDPRQTQIVCLQVSRVHKQSLSDHISIAGDFAERLLFTARG